MQDNGIDISPYLLSPLRTLAEAEEDHQAGIARRRMQRLRTGDGKPIEPMPSIEVRKQQQARQAGLRLPAGRQTGHQTGK